MIKTETKLDLDSLDTRPLDLTWVNEQRGERRRRQRSTRAGGGHLSQQYEIRTRKVTPLVTLSKSSTSISKCTPSLLSKAALRADK
jgi:hypothetical protein